MDFHTDINGIWRVGPDDSYVGPEADGTQKLDENMAIISDLISGLSGGGGGSGTPGGSNTQIQYNNDGSFAGDTAATTDGAGNLSATSLNLSGQLILPGTNGTGYVQAGTFNNPSGVSLVCADQFELNFAGGTLRNFDQNTSTVVPILLGSDLNLNGGSITNLTSITPPLDGGGQPTLTISGQLHGDGHDWCLKDGGGTGGGSLNMDSGSIYMAGGSSYYDNYTNITGNGGGGLNLTATVVNVSQNLSIGTGTTGTLDINSGSLNMGTGTGSGGGTLSMDGGTISNVVNIEMLGGSEIRLAPYGTHSGGSLHLEAGTLDFGDGYGWQYSNGTGRVGTGSLADPVFDRLILVGGNIQTQINSLASSIPTNVSALTNDANYITSSNIPTTVSSFTNDVGYITVAGVTWSNLGGTAPTNVSYFTNDANYVTSSSIPTNVSSFTNDAGYITSSSFILPTNVQGLGFVSVANGGTGVGSYADLITALNLGSVYDAAGAAAAITATSLGLGGGVSTTLNLLDADGVTTHSLTFTNGVLTSAS